jgi:hypothetical protein
MLRFTFHDTSRVVVRTMCSKRSRINPVTEGARSCQGLLDLPTDSVGLGGRAESRIRNPRPPSYRETLDADQTHNYSFKQPANPFYRTCIGARTAPLRNRLRPPDRGVKMVSKRLLAIPFATGAQPSYSVEAMAINPRAVSVINGGTALLVSYCITVHSTNTGIVFDTRFRSRLRSIALSLRPPVCPGNAGSAQWGGSAWLSTTSPSGHVTVWPQSVIFADVSDWPDNGINEYAFRTTRAERVALGVNGRGAISCAGRNQPSAEQDELRSNVQAGACLVAAAGSGARTKWRRSGLAGPPCVLPTPILEEQAAP